MVATSTLAPFMWACPLEWATLWQGLLARSCCSLWPTGPATSAPRAVVARPGARGVRPCGTRRKRMSLDEKQTDPVQLETPRRPLPALLDYFATLGRFSRNARLFLSYALLSGLGTGIWNVMFNIYLLRLGYETTFVGLFWMVDMLFHGLFAFPAGLIGDKIGRRKTFVF